MNIFLSLLIWLATGGSTGLQSYKFEALKGRNVCLFPDQGKYEQWNEQMERLQSIHTTINFQPTSIDCEKWFEENELEKGGDIADYYLRKNPQ